MPEELLEPTLILAAEDCDPSTFSAYHRFSKNDARIISKLIAHGPVLLQGGRGSGKSALMIQASNQLFPQNNDGNAIGIYLSLRHLPLLRSSDREYEVIFCDLLIKRIKEVLHGVEHDFDADTDVGSVQAAISQLSSQLGRRIVLMFDDAAHIGRETSLAEFFDIFRTLSSSTISCKATIYPGVTQFGTRFDVYNDATVVDVSRNEEEFGFDQQFLEIINARTPSLWDIPITGSLKQIDVAGFLGQSVLGNMRAFVFLCNELMGSSEPSIGFNTLGQALLRLGSNYYWPLLDEVSPKLGKYTPMVEPTRRIAEAILSECGSNGARRFALVHREIISRLAKPFEILEYVGFVTRRDVSRSLKSGGRGTRYALSLCILLESVLGRRLTSELFEKWRHDREEPVEFHVKGDKLAGIVAPQPETTSELAILLEPVSKLATSHAYPYGLTDHMIATLNEAGINTVRNLAETSDESLDELPQIGPAKIKRIRNVVGQAVWM
jgi:hypothetical protein